MEMQLYTNFTNLHEFQKMIYMNHSPPEHFRKVRANS